MSVHAFLGPIYGLQFLEYFDEIYYAGTFWPKHEPYEPSHAKPYFKTVVR